MRNAYDAHKGDIKQPLGRWVVQIAEGQGRKKSNTQINRTLEGPLTGTKFIGIETRTNFVDFIYLFTREAGISGWLSPFKRDIKPTKRPLTLFLFRSKGKARKG